MMKADGESPEGNATAAMTAKALANEEVSTVVTVPRGVVRVTHPTEFPRLGWLSADLLARVTANLEDGLLMAESPDGCMRKEDSSAEFCYTVLSQSRRGNPYTVKIRKMAVFPVHGELHVRNMISCNCPGHAVTLAKAGDDRICKHCCMILKLCLKAHPTKGAYALGVPKVTEARSSFRGRSPAPLPKPRVLAIEDKSSKGKTTVESEGKVKPVGRTKSLPEHKLLGSVPRLEPAAPAAKAVPPEVPQRICFEDVEFFQGYRDDIDDAPKVLFNPEGYGRVLSMMGGKETHKMAVYLLTKAKVRAHLTGFTFDYLPLSTALIEAAARDVSVTCYLDYQHAMTGTTQAMPDRLNDMREKGVQVWLCRGVAVSLGIQHSKTLLVDDYLIVGSTNWTNASRNNQEMGVLIRLSEAGWNSWNTRLGFMTQQTIAFMEEDYHRGRGNRVRRSKSAGAEQYATAKRFSIARERSLARAESAALQGTISLGSVPRLAPAAPADGGRTWVVADFAEI